MRKISFAAVCLIGFAVSSAHALPQPEIVDKYTGGFKDDYPGVLQRVRIMAPLAQQDVITHLGLMLQKQVFSHPVTIRFDDGVPVPNENSFFYIQPAAGDTYGQVLMVNVEGIARFVKGSAPHDNQIRKAFYYAMTHLVLNDIAGGETDKLLPLWYQEGLAVQVSEMGKDFVKQAAEKVQRSQARVLVLPLNEPRPYLGPRLYAQYYLAIQYIIDTHGTDSLQQLTRDMINGKSAADAIQSDLNQDWPAFEKGVETYSEQAFAAFALPDEEEYQQQPRRGVGRRSAY